MVSHLRVRNRTVQSTRMLRKPNEIAVEWMESKDAGKRHRVKMKHMIVKLEVAVGEVVVNLNSQHYCSEVVDLLEWPPPQRRDQWREKTEGVKGVLSSFLACILVLRSRLLFLPPFYMLMSSVSNSPADQ